MANLKTASQCMDISSKSIESTEFPRRLECRSDPERKQGREVFLAFFNHRRKTFSNWRFCLCAEGGVQVGQLFPLLRLHFKSARA